MVDHAHILTGLYDDAPTILHRTEDDFVAALLDDLKNDDPVTTLQPSLNRVEVINNPTASNDVQVPNVMRLYQPVHGTFHMVVCRAICDVFGEPRLDPGQIESAGMVIRRFHRLGRTGMDYSKIEGWGKFGHQVGWKPLNTVTSEHLLDPQIERRPDALLTGDKQFDLMVREMVPTLFMQQSPLEEQTVPLFVAPPEVCEKSGETILFGYLPTTSGDVSKLDQPTFETVQGDTIASLFPNFLKNVGGARDLPAKVSQGRHVFKYNYTDDDPDDEDAKPREQNFISFLSFLSAIGLGTVQSAEVTAVINVLAGVLFTVYEDRGDTDPMLQADEETPVTVNASQFVLNSIARTDDQGLALTDNVNRWVRWSLPSAVRTQLNNALAALLMARAKDLRISNGEKRYATQEGRNDPAEQYTVMAYMRVRRDDDCPPETVWTQVSTQPFVIAPWYATDPFNDKPLPLIEVPSPNDFKNMKPNVSFKVPDAVQQFLNQDPFDMLKGDVSMKEDSGLGIAWICSISIQIVFFIAFMLLFIFVFILNFVFWWIAWIKICIPIPAKK